MLRRPAAISWPGVVLSHDARHTIPSSSAPSTCTSMSAAIRSRDGRMYAPRRPALVMKSLGALVRISNGSPPAARIAFLSSAASPSRWLKQLDSSDEEFTMAIFGFAMSASVRPSARHCAIRPAQSGVPASRLLRSLCGTRRLLRDGAEEGAVALQLLLERTDVDLSWRQTIRERQIGGRTRGLAHDETCPRDPR